MTFDDYQTDAAMTAVGRFRKVRAVLGLADEAGEVCGVRKKMYRGDFDEAEYQRRLKAELGDVLWYLAEVCTTHGISLEVVAAANLDKLQDRAERGVIQGDGDER